MGIYGPSKRTKKEDFVALPSISTIVSHSPDHSKFFNLIKKAKLLTTLSAADGLTVFAPTDAALKDLDVEKMTSANAKTIVLGHVLQYSKAPPPNYKKMKSFATLQNGGKRIQASDVQSFMNSPVHALNGVLYVIEFTL